MTMGDKPRPGSPEAIAHGCTCPADVNNHGQGATGVKGCQYVCDWQCPVHSMKPEDLRKAQFIYPESRTIH